MPLEPMHLGRRPQPKTACGRDRRRVRATGQVQLVDCDDCLVVVALERKAAFLEAYEQRMAYERERGGVEYSLLADQFPMPNLAPSPVTLLEDAKE